MSEEPIELKTPLHSLHVQLGAKMVPFAGYQMPVSYPAGIMTEHRHCRDQAGLFDVSHMGQIDVHGHDIASHLETELPVDLIGLLPGRQKYALLLNEAGGIRDDLMVMHRGDHFRLVVNAACKQDDLAYLQDSLGDKLALTPREDLALLALQGPASPKVLLALGAEEAQLEKMKFLHVGDLKLKGIECVVSRSGYTGEDGFEISLPAGDAEMLAQAILDHPAAAPIGLGARDSLRMEAGLCLYGQDIDHATSPAEAGLKWAISAVRRRGGDRAGGFPGDERILEELVSGASRRLVGLLPEGRAPMRAGTPLFTPEGNAAGKITSGGFGPTLASPISMGYVDIELAQPGTPLTGEVRGKQLPLAVAELPFVPQRYHR